MTETQNWSHVLTDRPKVDVLVRTVFIHPKMFVHNNNNNKTFHFHDDGSHLTPKAHSHYASAFT